jgi:hypothetical protein
MMNIKVIKRALAASLAAGAFCFAATAADIALTPEPAAIAEPAPARPATATPFTAPRYFNPYTPRRDNPTNPPGTWEVYPSPTTKDLYAVDFIDANNGWAVGRGVALRYRGGTWFEITGHAAHNLRDLDMVSINDGWAVGRDGNDDRWKIWRCNGTDWRIFQVVTGAIYCIDMINASRGWIGGNGYFLRFNGSTWEWGGSAPDTMYDIQMNSDTDGRAVGYHYVMRRIGNNWFNEASSNNWNLGRICMVGSSEGWASGNYLPSDKGFLLVYDGNWKEHIIFNDVLSVAGLDFNGRDFGWCSGWKNYAPPYGAFLAFYDGAKWNIINTPTNKGLMCVDILDKRNGWVVGEAGVILRYKANVSVEKTSLGRIKSIYR